MLPNTIDNLISKESNDITKVATPVSNIFRPCWPSSGTGLRNQENAQVYIGHREMEIYVYSF